MTNIYSTPAEEGIEAGRAMYNTVWLPRSGGKLFPVDPFQVADALGIDCFPGELEYDVAGALWKEFGSDPVIVVNQYDRPPRQNFTVAHELGHFLLREAELEPKYK